MFKSRQHPRRGQNQQQTNPVSDMEQFYLHQYFGQNAPNRQIPMPAPVQPPLSGSMPSMDLAKLHQLEARIARIEEYLGLGPTQTSPDFSIR